MSSEVSYHEQLLNEARSEGKMSDDWLAVVYDDSPIAYVCIGDERDGVFRGDSEVESYQDFLVELDRNRDELSDEILGLNSYDIVERTLECNPRVLYKLAGDDFGREIDKEIRDRFDERDSEDPEGEIGDRFDMLTEGIEPSVETVVEGNLDRFKKTMDREQLVDESKVVYEESLGELYATITELQGRNPV